MKTSSPALQSPNRPRKRAANGSGTVVLRKDGRYAAAIRVTLPSGARKRVTAYGHTREEAHAKMLALQYRESQGIPIPEKNWTLGEYLDYWLRDVVSIKNRERTYELYELTARHHIKPYLGNVRLNSLSVVQVQQTINYLVSAGVSARSVHKMRTVLSSALGRAEREELVHRNVAKLVELPKYRRKDIRPWSAEEATRFLRTAKGHQWEPAYRCLIMYGMRRGEVVGLRWKDIDFPNNQIHVRQQIQRINGQLRSGPVKTDAGHRTLPLIPALREVFIAHALKTGVPLDVTKHPDDTSYGDELIIRSKTDEPVEPGNFARTFYLLSEKAELPRITVHHTRHTAATLLKHLGVPARDAQLILGHSNITTTQQLYQHGDIEGQRAALALMEKLIDPDKDEPQKTDDILQVENTSSAEVDHEA